MATPGRHCPRCGARYAEGELFCPADGAALGARPEPPGEPLEEGLLLPGDVAVGKLLGAGAMARVYRARQRSLGRDVAVKVLRPRHLGSPDLVQRFLREGRIAGALSHPNLVTVHAAGEVPSTGAPYLVLELLEGAPLRGLLGAVGALAPARAVAVGLGIADGLGEAHAEGVVHRDLSPENVLLVRSGADPEAVKVVDFGLARRQGDDAGAATHAGAVLGTPAYASPESARGEAVGPPADVYSLAVVLFECLAGRPPFEGRSAVDLLVQHATRPAPPLPEAGPAGPLPRALRELLARQLSKHPRDRAPDARALGQELLAAACRAGLAGAVQRRRTLEGEGPARAEDHA